MNIVVDNKNYECLLLFEIAEYKFIRVYLIVYLAF